MNTSSKNNFVESKISGVFGLALHIGGVVVFGCRSTPTRDPPG